MTILTQTNSDSSDGLRNHDTQAAQDLADERRGMAMFNVWRRAGYVILAGTAGLGAPATAATPEKIVHVFIGYDGSQPVAELSNVNGILFGVTSEGGAPGGGTIFSVTPEGVPKVLHSFGVAGDGANPAARLIEMGGMLYGTTQNGGTAPCGCGTVFSTTLSGQVTTLHSFAGGTDGANPVARLTELNGTLYGTTMSGGTNGAGAVFSVTASGTESVLYSFGGSGDGGDGSSPAAGLENVDGVLYGTTSSGGTGTYCFRGCGTVFSITPAGVETVLYSFKGFHWGGGQRSSDGAVPMAGVINFGGTLYGTTSEGGFFNFGTVFSITLTGAERVLHSFSGPSKRDGQQPVGALAEFNGDLYGTTKAGGEGNGTVFVIPFKKGSPAKESVVYFFGGVSEGDGTAPAAGLLPVKSALYGTTIGGGIGGTGTVFRFAP